MNRGYDYKQYKILYVDDESQALKYFQKACEKDFDVLVASSVEEARPILEAESEAIGVIITDQRMPKETGVELLTKIREQHPGMVRILTTAYSDLDSAIEAVNSGAIYQYVTKPWDIRELRGVLMRAMELFLLQRDRDLLLREKLSAIHRVLLADRIRSLVVLTSSLDGFLRRPIEALLAFLALASETKGTLQPLDSGADLWELARQESQQMIEIIDGVHGEIGVEGAENAAVGLEPILREAIGTAEPVLHDRRTEVVWSVDDAAPTIGGEDRALRRLLNILMAWSVESSERGGQLKIELAPCADVHGTPGIQLRIRTGKAAWSPDRLLQFVDAANPGTGGARNVDGFLAFLMAHHHGGELRFQTQTAEGPLIELKLPASPSAASPPERNPDWLNQLYISLEDWEQIAPSD